MQKLTAKTTAQELVNKFKAAHLAGQVFTDDFDPERERKHMEESKKLTMICINECRGVAAVIGGESGKVIGKYLDNIEREIKRL